MKRFILFTCVLAAPLLTQCVVIDAPGARPVAPQDSRPGGQGAPNVTGSAAQSQDVYNLGHQMGFDDGRSGASRNPQRHAGAYPFGESDAFEMGYEKGYNQGIR